MGTTWGDLRLWSQLDQWWIPNAAEGASVATASAASATGGNLVFADPHLAVAAVESFAAASRTAVATGGNVVECASSASALVVANHTADGALEVAAGASASAVRVPPRDRPAGALLGRIRS